MIVNTSNFAGIMISCLFICCVNFTRFTLTYTHSTHSLHLHAMGRNKELTEAQRGAIIYCRKRGDKLCAIAKTVGCGVTTVRDTLKRHAETGHTQSRKRSGRPPLLDSADRQRLKRLVTRKAEYRRLCKAAVQRVWLKKTGKKVSGHTVSRALRSAGLRNCIARPKPLVSPANKAARLAWCLEHENWTRKWRKVLWSDESTFSQFQQSRSS